MPIGTRLNVPEHCTVWGGLLILIITFLVNLLFSPAKSKIFSFFSTLLIYDLLVSILIYLKLSSGKAFVITVSKEERPHKFL